MKILKENTEKIIMRGRVKWFSNKLGYGFIKSENIEKDIFVHFSEIQVDGYKYLMENDVVEFEFDEEKNKALNVRIIKKGSQVSNFNTKSNSKYSWRN